MPKRLVMMVSGGSAALVVLAACLLLIQSGNRREIAPQPRADLSSMAMPEASGPAALRESAPAYPSPRQCPRRTLPNPPPPPIRSR